MDGERSRRKDRIWLRVERSESELTVARYLMHLGQTEGTAGFSGPGPSQHPIPLDAEELTTGQRGPTASQGLGESGSEKVSLNWLPWDLNLTPPLVLPLP